MEPVVRLLNALIQGGSTKIINVMPIALALTLFVMVLELENLVLVVTGKCVIIIANASVKCPLLRLLPVLVRQVLLILVRRQ
jgi:hypothetical protein